MAGQDGFQTHSEVGRLRLGPIIGSMFTANGRQSEDVLFDLEILIRAEVGEIFTHFPCLTLGSGTTLCFLNI